MKNQFKDFFQGIEEIPATSSIRVQGTQAMATSTAFTPKSEYEDGSNKLVRYIHLSCMPGNTDTSSEESRHEFYKFARILQVCILFRV